MGGRGNAEMCMVITETWRPLIRYGEWKWKWETSRITGLGLGQRVV